MIIMLVKNIILIAVFFYVLVRAANLTVTHITGIAKHLKMSHAVIGATLLSISTGLPEIGVAIMAALSHAPAISLGDILGSNIANLGLVMGVGALAYSIHLKRKMTWPRYKMRILLIIAIIPVILVLINCLNWIVGLALLCVFVLYNFAIFWRERVNVVAAIRKRPRKKRLHPKKIDPKSFLKSLGLFSLGVAGVLIASRIIVNSASDIAQTLSLSQTFIGATLVALGTSLPELSIDLTALKNKQVELALGDIIGSCIINLTLVLGLLGVLSTVTINIRTMLLPALFGLLVVAFFWYLIDVRKKIDTKSAVVLLILYFLFIMLSFLNEVGTPFFQTW